MQRGLLSLCLPEMDLIFFQVRCTSASQVIVEVNWSQEFLLLSSIRRLLVARAFLNAIRLAVVGVRSRAITDVVIPPRNRMPHNSFFSSWNSVVSCGLYSISN